MLRSMIRTNSAVTSPEVDFKLRIHQTTALDKDFKYSTPKPRSGCGRLVIMAGGHVASSSPIPLKAHPVGARCTLNLSKTQTSSCWGGEEVRRGVFQLRCRPRHLTIVQNYEAGRQKPSCSGTVQR
ncbi:uncharacterized protein TNCV_4241731 [Trichonephila clavipes]|nr:uncharacterized protein TNCV_4241731 [Trichonephila clavipes]